MKLSEEDTSLAKMIALLHDIGRFEQLKQFDSFLPDTMDHAAYGVKILFDNAPHQNLIRNFIPESDFDEIIRISIAKHSDFKLDGISDARTLLHAKIIRDADKLDNCRVKLEDRLETFMDTSAEETGASAISPKVRDSILRHECILSSDRVQLHVAALDRLDREQERHDLRQARGIGFGVNIAGIVILAAVLVGE